MLTREKASQHVHEWVSRGGELGRKNNGREVFGGDPGPSWRALTFGDETAVRGGFAALHEGYPGPARVLGEGGAALERGGEEERPREPRARDPRPERRRGVRHVRVRGVLQERDGALRAPGELREGRERQHEREGERRAHARGERGAHGERACARAEVRGAWGRGRDKTDDKSNITSDVVMSHHARIMGFFHRPIPEPRPINGRLDRRGCRSTRAGRDPSPRKF